MDDLQVTLNIYSFPLPSVPLPSLSFTSLTSPLSTDIDLVIHRGVGSHNAALDNRDRALIESLFIKGTTLV